jgi:hypothetical protein
MSEAFLTFFGIYLLCLIKFFAGPVLGAAAGYNAWEIIGVSVSGMMTSVTFFTFLGARVKKALQAKSSTQKKVFTKKNRRIVRIWGSYGEVGIALLTPILLTPIGGTLILVSFGSDKRKILLYMLLSGLAWGALFSFSIEWILSFPLVANLIG